MLLLKNGLFTLFVSNDLLTSKAINDKILNAIGTNKIPRVLVGNKTDLAANRYRYFLRGSSKEQKKKKRRNKGKRGKAEKQKQKRRE